ncbi:MAG: lytic murein transglycosylase, partial [Enterovirga sp.]|nr:lytic murein transglycosylase [Enterovirga sp.]
VGVSLALLLASVSAGGSAVAQPAIPGAEFAPRSFDSLPGWREDDHAAAFRAFRKTCPAIAEGTRAGGTARPAPDGLQAACRDALAQGPDREAARAFFERRFTPFEVLVPGGRGFLTGYYEPEFRGALEPSAEFPVPLLAPPDDLVTLEPGEVIPNLPAGATAARRTPAGLEPYPDRAAIEDGAIADRTRPVAFVRDGVDLFIIQVQGSARLRLSDGKAVRVGYAGKNGLPYTSVARLLVQKLGIQPADMTADVLTSWLRDNPAEARELLRRNRSYVFFRLADELDPADGPLGAAGVPVSAGRTLAVDRELWSFGLPVWLEGELPEPGGGTVPLRRLSIAQDTGSAIKGPARGDLFFGSGPEAGLRAGLVRHDVRFVVLWPRPDAAAAAAKTP